MGKWGVKRGLGYLTEKVLWGENVQYVKNYSEQCLAYTTCTVFIMVKKNRAKTLVKDGEAAPSGTLTGLMGIGTRCWDLHQGRETGLNSRAQQGQAGI